MSTRSQMMRIFSILTIISLLLNGMSALAAPAAQADTIVIDGIKEAAWGAPLGSDPAGDMTEPNLDLQNLYVVENATDYYIGFDATASNWGMAYGLYIDTDQIDGSGATADPWDRRVNAVSAHLPEHTLYVWHQDNDLLQDVQLNHWNGSGWSYDSLISQGGAQAYGPANDWVEYRVPKTALGSPARISLELFTTGGDGHAQDTSPSDPNVAFTAPDWSGLTTTLSAFVTFPRPTWFARGDFNGWGTSNPLYDDGAHGDVFAGDGIYTARVTVGSAGRHEFKIATEDWATAYPQSGNSWLDTTAPNEVVTITFDVNVRDDGWLPTTNIIGVSTEPAAWTAVGDWQGWNNSNPATAMSALTGGRYRFTTSIASPGVYQFKAVKTGTWDAVGADGRSVNASTAAFETIDAGQHVTFTADTLAGRVKIEVEVLPPRPRLDNDIWWDGLRHDSRDPLYRTPGGAAPAGTPVTLRFRTYHNDVTSVKARVYDLNSSSQTIYTMAPVAADVSCYQDLPFTCDFWAVTLPNAAPNNLWYRFIVTDGGDTDYYADNTPALDGGLGRVTDEVVDHSYALMIYDRAFDTPAWASNAVIYQIFPDRFRNGRADNDPKTGDVRYDDPVLKLPWGTLPEGYCRNYADGATNCLWRFDDTPPPSSPDKEQPRGRDYLGGDLKGVDQQLNYLKALGVTAIYFNPIFDAGSNHSYDTQDYYKIDPYFGTQKDWENLVKHARQRGIRIILDGVFNHLSSDSPFFDRYHHYETVGACESADSPYRDWFNFRAPAGNEPAPCAPSTPGGSDTYYDGWFGFDSIPVINKTLPEVQAYFLTGQNSISRYWLNQGASAWRMDVMGDSSFPDGYWQTFRGVVKNAKPDALIISETWQKDSTLLRMLRGDRADTTMNYRLRDAVIGLLTPGPFDSKGFADSGRIIAPSEFAARLESIREDYPDATYYSLMNLLDSHDTERLLWALTPGAETVADKELNAANVAAGKRGLQIASLIQFSLPGAPTVFYGDEVGLTGDDDPDDRRTYPWADLGGSPDNNLFSYYQTLAALRRQNQALTGGDFQVLLADDASQVVAYGRKTGSQAAIVIVNRSNQARMGAIPVAGYLPDGVTLQAAYVVGSGGPSSVTVANRQLDGTIGPKSALLLLTGLIDLQPPQAPTGLSVTSEGDAQVSLAWDSVPGAAGYNVYRSPLSGGGFVKVTQSPIADLQFTDTGLRNAQTVYYVVRALDAAGNESDLSSEVSALPHYTIGWANLQWPPTMNHTISTVNRTPDAYGQVWIDSVTSQPGATPSLRAQLGFGPEGSNPDGNPAWNWVDARFNVNAGDNDEFVASLLPEAVGTFDYVYRYSTTNGRDWLYADLNGPIPAGNQPPNPGKLTVVSSGDTTAPDKPTGLHVVSATPAGVELAWNAVMGDPSLYGYEVRRSSASGGPYTTIALITGATGYVDLAVSEGATYYYVVRSIDTSFNRSAHSDEVAATPQLRTVTLVFNVTVPATTDATGRSVYIAGTLDRLDGGLPQWDAGGVVLSQDDATHWTIRLTGKEATQIEYKYTLGDWDHVEKNGACGEIANRLLTLSYGASGTQIVNDTVLNWRNVAPCGN